MLETIPTVTRVVNGSNVVHAPSRLVAAAGDGLRTRQLRVAWCSPSDGTRAILDRTERITLAHLKHAATSLSDSGAPGPVAPRPFRQCDPSRYTTCAAHRGSGGLLTKVASLARLDTATLEALQIPAQWDVGERNVGDRHAQLASHAVTLENRSDDEFSGLAGCDPLTSG